MKYAKINIHTFRGYAVLKAILFMLAALFHFLGNCSELTSVELPSTLTLIKRYSFSDDPKLKTVTCKAANPPTIEESGTVFFVWGKPSSLDSVTLRVPAGSEALYRAAERWKEFGTIVEF